MVVTHPLFPHGSGTAVFVLDASVAFGWIVTTPLNWYANRVMSSLGTKRPVVPTSWISHVADLLLGAERQGLVTQAVTAAKLPTLRGFPILFDDETDARMWGDIRDLARTHDLSVFAAAYLELALRLTLPLATTDASLSRTAISAGVSIFTP